MLHQNHMAYSIIDIETGKLLASSFTPKPHEAQLYEIGWRGNLDKDKVISVIALNKGDNKVYWDLRYDLDGHLRKTQLLSQANWLKLMLLAAQTLIDNGANPEDKVSFDGDIETTLGG